MLVSCLFIYIPSKVKIILATFMYMNQHTFTLYSIVPLNMYIVQCVFTFLKYSIESQSFRVDKLYV